MARAERPYDVRPERLYTRDDLMQGWRPGADHSATLDGRIYAYVKAHGGRAPDVDEGLAQRTHDHFIDVALARFLMRTGRPVVGDHGRVEHPRGRPQLPARRPPGGLARRGAGTWSSAAAASGSWRPRISARTWPSARTRDRDDAVDALAAAPPWPTDPAGYMGVADGIRERCAPGSESLAIPTWVTAGEPISQFASHIAKYFSNSIREDGMLAVATAGIVFAPGGAGTMQEIFQDAAQNAYASSAAARWRSSTRSTTAWRPASTRPCERQAVRLGFADLLSISDEPAQILDRFPAVAAHASLDRTPEMLVRRLRNPR